MIKDWFKNWRVSFYKIFCFGVNNYFFDSQKDEVLEDYIKVVSNYGIDGGNVM